MFVDIVYTISAGLVIFLVIVFSALLFCAKIRLTSNFADIAYYLKNDDNEFFLEL